MNINDLLDKKISFQATARTPLSKELTIRDVLEDIKSGKCFDQIKRLRLLILDDRLDEYNIHKTNLPAVTFCGTFNGKRRREFLKEYSQIIVLDIDKLSSVEFKRIKKVLKEDDVVFAFWESPSQNGFKGLVFISYKNDLNITNIGESHKWAFRKLQKYFKEAHNVELDKSGSDTTRLCFLSYDASLVLKQDFKPFVVDKIEVEEVKATRKQSSANSIRSVSERDVLYNPKNRNRPFDRKVIQSIIKFLTKNNKSITSTYENWYRVAIATANSFTYEIGEKYFLNLCKIDKEKFNENNCKNMLIYSYENRKDKISFGTIIFLAEKKGYKINKKREVVPKAALTRVS